MKKSGAVLAVQTNKNHTVTHAQNSINNFFFQMSARSKFGGKLLVNNKLKLPASNLENKIKILSFFDLIEKKNFN
jgi:hypothetical protein